MIRHEGCAALRVPLLLTRPMVIPSVAGEFAPQG